MPEQAPGGEKPPAGFKQVTEQRFNEMFEILPPAQITSDGFLVGEQMSARTCKITGLHRPTFTAFMTRGGAFYEALEPMTVGEFRASRL